MSLRSVWRLIAANWGVLSASLVWEVVSSHIMPPLEGPGYAELGLLVLGMAATLSQIPAMMITQLLLDHVAPVLYGSVEYRLLQLTSYVLGYCTILGYLVLLRLLFRLAICRFQRAT